MITFSKTHEQPSQRMAYHQKKSETMATRVMVTLDTEWKLRRVNLKSQMEITKAVVLARVLNRWDS